MLRLRSTATGWEIVDLAGNVIHSGLGTLGTLTGGAFTQTPEEQLTYAHALGLVASAMPVVAAGTGVLEERWHSPVGIAFAERIDIRDFTSVQWSWRDPTESLLPLMFLDSNSGGGHIEAVLAGYIEQLRLAGAAVQANGRFYDIDAGRMFRDVVQGSGRFGVSVDPGPSTAATFTCDQEDEDGFCEVYHLTFSHYEIIGLTGVPMPGFPRAAIEFVTEPASTSSEGMAAGNTAGQRGRTAPLARPTPIIRELITVPAVPPRSWFEVPEPAFDDPLYVQQDRAGHIAIPLQITDDGRVFGHLAYWGQCHVGFPGVCIEPPASECAYAHFHVVNTPTDTGDLATGNLFAGTDHASLSLRMGPARDHYANSGFAWATLRAVNGEHGPWVCGALLPGLSEPMLRLLQATVPSGDWRYDDKGHLELITALSVNSGGYPIAREAITAAGSPQLVSHPHAQAEVVGGRQTALVAAGIVRSCPDCQRRSQAALAASGSGDLAEVLGILRRLEARTEHLVASEARHQLARLGAGSTIHIEASGANLDEGRIAAAIAASRRRRQ